MSYLYTVQQPFLKHNVSPKPKFLKLWSVEAQGSAKVLVVPKDEYA